MGDDLDNETLAKHVRRLLEEAGFQPVLHDETMRVARRGFLVEAASRHAGVWVSLWMPMQGVREGHTRATALVFDDMYSRYTQALMKAGGFAISRTGGAGGYPYLSVRRAPHRI